MVRRAVDAARAAGVSEVIVVVGADAQGIIEALPLDITVAIQSEPRGTGDAVNVGLRPADPVPSRVLVIGGDTPLISASTLKALVAEVPPAVIAMAVSDLPAPEGYGRVVLNSDGGVDRIVEEADATPAQRAISTVNGMVFAFEGAWLREFLPSVEPAPSGEGYLTTLVERAAAQGRVVSAVRAEDPWEIMGVNDRQQLSAAEAEARDRVRRRLMESGVTLLDPASTFVDESAVLRPNVVLHPNTYIRGLSVIGARCELGPGAEVIDSQLGEETRVWWSVVEGARTGPRVHIGPYCRVRPGTILEAEVSLGSFAEVKNSHVGERTQMHHFSYLGDATLGSRVNIGAGSITCNYDGVDKHETLIGDEVFVGSDTLLVAPVTVGDGAVTGAGSDVTKDVPPKTLVVGVPARRIGPARLGGRRSANAPRHRAE